jgi:pimeloyl-ACP methyl ester carboxylesterase
MGHSLGGYLSGRFLAKFRTSSGVRGLVLLSSTTQHLWIGSIRYFTRSIALSSH